MHSISFSRKISGVVFLRCWGVLMEIEKVVWIGNHGGAVHSPAETDRDRTL